MKRAVLAAAIAAAVLTGCGNGTKPASSKSTGSPAPTGAVSVPSSQGSSLPSGASKQTTPSSLKPSEPVSLPPTPPDHVVGTDKAPLQVDIASKCVIRGTAQTITVHSTPAFQISWATVYADGKTHQEYNGWGVGTIPPGGVYTSTWTIPANGPLGDARTDVAVAGKVKGKDSTAFAHAFYRVSTTC